MNTPLRIEITDNAQSQISAAAAWWAEHRSAAPGAIHEELDRVLDLLRVQPDIGTLARRATLSGVRRVTLSRIRYYVYYRVVGDALQVLAFWHTIPALRGRPIAHGSVGGQGMRALPTAAGFVVLLGPDVESAQSANQTVFHPKSVGPLTVVRALLVSCSLLTVPITAVACGSPAPTQPSVASTRIYTEISDPVGDAISDSRVQVSPDIVFGSVDVEAGSVVFKLRLAPGTFDSAITRFAIDFDIDQNRSTGESGVEYYVFIFPAGGRGADVARTTSTGYTVVGTVPVGFVADGCDVTVPLSLLGNDDGRFDFRVRVYSEPALPVVLDFMPDVGFARVQ